jgi:hypothetical protein
VPTLIRLNRDLRIDFFRGIALWCIFIDHLMIGNLRLITLKQYGFCDAAEIFMLLSGILAGLTYERCWIRDGLLGARLKMLRRVFAIYRTHVITYLLFLVEVGILIGLLKPHGFLEFLYLDRLSDHPVRSIVSAVLLRDQPRFFDILPLYVLFLLLLAVILPLIRRPRLLLACSVALYAATRIFHLELSGTEGWYLNPLAWQVIFMIGVTAPHILEAKRYWRGWDVLAVSFSLFSLLESHVPHLVNRVPSALLIHHELDKTVLHPFRILCILSWAWLAWRYIPGTAQWLRSRWARPLVLLGQHPLEVFATSILLSVLGSAFLVIDRGPVSQFLVQALGTLALVASAAIFALSASASQKSRAGSRVTGEPESMREEKLVAVYSSKGQPYRAGLVLESEGID